MSVAALLILMYVSFQLYAPWQGYWPMRSTAHVTYVFRSLIVIAIFWWGMALLLPRRFGEPLLAISLFGICLAALFYFCVVVAARPELAEANDRSEALSIALSALIRGDFPYGEVTQLGNRITALSGSLLLAAPFDLAFGRPELASIPILLCLFAVLSAAAAAGRNPLPPAIIATLVFLNPLIVVELVKGSDFFWGGVLVVLAAWSLERGRLVVSGCLLGLALCTRLLFFGLCPLWLVFIARRGNRKHLRFIAATALTVALLEIPIALWNPQVFWGHAPIGVSKLKLFEAFPLNDNALSDTLSLLSLVGPSRYLAVATFLLLLSSLAGMRVSETRDLPLFSAVILAASLFFMGHYFFLEYMASVVPLLLHAIVTWKPSDANSQGPVAQGQMDSAKSAIRSG